jgi:hypothetical protein
MGDKYPILRPNEIISALSKIRSILLQAGIELEEFLELL